MNIDELKDAVESIQAGVDQILKAGIKRKALYVLIQHATHQSRKPTLADIEAVVKGMENLKQYLLVDDED